MCEVWVVGDGLTDAQEIEGRDIAIYYQCTGEPKDEWHTSSNPNDPDADDDGIIDGLELDIDSDGDGDIDYLDDDSDNDGLPDGFKNGYIWKSEHGKFMLFNGYLNDDRDESDGFDPWEGEDKNCNGIVDEGETNPLKSDTDGDGLVYPDEDDTDPTLWDTDGDGLSDYDEVHVYNEDYYYDTEPLLWSSDSDSLSDGEEVNQYQTDPTKPDSDEDALDDSQESRSIETDPNTRDTDNDGILDSDEVKYGLSAKNPDTDGDGINDFEDNGVDPNDKDKSDGDTISNGLEIYVYGTDPTTDQTYSYTDNFRKKLLDKIRSSSKSIEFINDPYCKGKFIDPSNGDYENCYITAYHQRSPKNDEDAFNKDCGRYTVIIHQETEEFSLSLQSYNDDQFACLHNSILPTQIDGEDEFGRFTLKNLNSGVTYKSDVILVNGDAISNSDDGYFKNPTDPITITLDASATVTQGDTLAFSWKTKFDDESSSDTHSTMLVKTDEAKSRIIYICPGGGGSGSKVRYNDRIEFKNEKSQKLYFKGYTRKNDYLEGYIDTSDNDRKKIKLNDAFSNVITHTDNDEPIFLDSYFCYCLQSSNFGVGYNHIDFDWLRTDGKSHWQYHISSQHWGRDKDGDGIINSDEYDDDPKKNDYDGDCINDYYEAKFRKSFTDVLGSSFEGGKVDELDVFLEIDWMEQTKDAWKYNGAPPIVDDLHAIGGIWVEIDSATDGGGNIYLNVRISDPYTGEDKDSTITATGDDYFYEEPVRIKVKELTSTNIEYEIYESYRISDQAVERLINSYNNAPILNPNGLQGININIDNFKVEDADDEDTDGYTGDEGGGGTIPWQDTIRFSNDPDPNNPDVEDYWNDADYFNTVRKNNNWKYGISCRDLLTTGGDPTDGVCRIADEFLAVGCENTWANNQKPNLPKWDPYLKIPMTFKHETGHLLGLETKNYLGIDNKKTDPYGDDYDENLYSNYESVMNYQCNSLTEWWDYSHGNNGKDNYGHPDYCDYANLYEFPYYPPYNGEW